MTRVYHTWEKWECYPAGFYETSHPTLSKEECEAEYANFLRNDERFAAALDRVINEWPKSCEHYLSNPSMNRIAWLGQASLCIETGIPANYRAGFQRLTAKEQARANQLALDALNVWLAKYGEQPIAMEAAGVNAKADIY